MDPQNEILPYYHRNAQTPKPKGTPNFLETLNSSVHLSFIILYTPITPIYTPINTQIAFGNTSHQEDVDKLVGHDASTVETSPSDEISCKISWGQGFGFRIRVQG